MGNKKKKNKKNNRANDALRRRQEALAREKRNNIIIISITAFLAVALVTGILLWLGLGVFGWGDNPLQKFKATHHAAIEIENYGTVKLELYGKEAPETVENFVDLA